MSYIFDESLDYNFELGYDCLDEVNWPSDFGCNTPTKYRNHPDLIIFEEDNKFIEIPEDPSDEFSVLTKFHHKNLVPLLKSPKRVRTLDLDFVHPDVKYKLKYYDPLHNFINNKGYKLEQKHVIRIIKKCEGKAPSVASWKLKNCKKYKVNETFRQACQFFIEELECKGDQIDDDFFSVLRNNKIKIENNVLKLI